MAAEKSNLFGRIDWALLGSVLFLTLIGLQTIFNLSISDSGLTRFDKQIIALLLGLAAVVVLVKFDYRRIGAWSWFLYSGSILLLVAVLWFGTTLGGTTGWFVVGNFAWQPVELVKVAMVVVLSFYLARRTRISKARRWLESFGLLLPIIVLLALQPDIGPVLLLLIIWFVINAVMGLRRRGWLLLLTLTLICGFLVWQFGLTQVQQNRVESLFNPLNDPTGASYQARQSIIAVGAGGVLGRGAGQGFQSQLQFLPAAATDFMFAAVLEERGLVGFLLIWLLWLAIFWRLVRLQLRAKDSFTFYLVFGLGLLFMVQAVVNMAMNIGLLPVVGLPLPFVSYGGSALLAEYAALGLLLSAGARQKATMT